MNHYDCLKVTSDAPTEVIRAAYRALAGKSHPDRQGGTMGRDDETHIQMVAINAAYEVLINPDLRAEYDAMLAARGRTSEAAKGGAAPDALERDKEFSETRVDIDWVTPKAAGPTPLWPLVGVRKYFAVALLIIVSLSAIFTAWQMVLRHQMDKALSDQYAALPVRQSGDEEPSMAAAAQALSVPRVTTRARAPAIDAEVPLTPEEVLASERRASSPPGKTQAPLPSFERQPTVTELSKLSDEELMAILPSLGELQPAKGSFSRQLASTHHPLDGKPLNLRTDKQLVDPLAPEALKR